ncbi:MAG: diflavin oxidoreductase [Alphaproteobacteria bacterium]
MLNTDQKNLLAHFVKASGQEQLIWASGYLQGLAGQVNNTSALPKPVVHVYYATETGNSKALSLSVMKALRSAGYKAKNTAVNRLKIDDLKKAEHAIFLVSTHGEGTPPEGAIDFFVRLREASDQSLEGLSYAVLGLGDKSYDIFCGAATTLDKELQRLGANALQEIGLFDVDYASHTLKWIDAIVANLDQKHGAASQSISATTSSDVYDEPVVRTGKGYSRLDPVKGIVKQIVNLNDQGSNKETYHLEITYDDGIVYTPGDAIGIILPQDDNGAEQTPRLYSVASSPSAHEGEVHLTVGLATYVTDNGKIGYGVASSYLANRQVGDEITFYVHQNHIFNLAPDDRDIIMIGPGTGIAPFRSFVYERVERGATGRNWLFFGDQHADRDFLYQAEWQEHLATDSLHRIDLAFSRDQEKKIYVQNRLQEKAEEVVSWLDSGATLYVCGAKDPMGKDVEKTLLDIIAAQKSLSAEKAVDYLANLEEQNRYLKDVY